MFIETYSWKSISVLGLIVLFALIPSILLYLLFVGNSATVEWLGGNVSLGGPIAAFFALLLLLNWMYGKIQQRREAALGRALAKISPFLGSWKIITESSGVSHRKAMSDLTLAIEDDRLEISGGSFFDKNNDGSKGKAIGQWNCDVCVFDGQRLIYHYLLTDTKAVKRDWRGFVDATYDPDRKCFDGRWQVIGPEFHEGTMQIRRAKGKRR